MAKRCGNRRRALAKARSRVGTIENGWKITKFLGIGTKPGKQRSRFRCVCTVCGETSTRTWVQVRKYRCGECGLRRSVHRGRIGEAARIHLLRQIPQKLLRAPGAINAIVEIFGPLDRREVGVVLGIMEKGRELDSEMIRLIESRAMKKLRDNAPKELLELLKEKPDELRTVWQTLLDCS